MMGVTRQHFQSRGVMAVSPLIRPAQVPSPRLAAFDADRHVDTVASWVRSDYEAYMLAPRSVPPISPEHIRGWGGPCRMQTVLLEPDAFEPVAYGELNALETAANEFWLGHLI